MRSKSSSVSKAQYQTRHPTGPAKDFFREPSIQGSAPLTSHGPRPQWKPFLLSCYPSQIKCRPCARALCPSEEIDSFKREGLSGGGPQPSQGPCRERHGSGQGAIAASPARILRTRRTPLRPGLRSALALGLSYPVALSWPTSCESALSSAGREICRGFTRQDTEITTRQLGLILRPEPPPLATSLPLGTWQEAVAQGTAGQLFFFTFQGLCSYHTPIT